MSYVTLGCVEILYPEPPEPRRRRTDPFVRGACILHFDSIPHIEAVLNFPWGKHSKEDDLPAPIVKPRGLPKDPFPSLLTLAETTVFVDAKGVKEGNPRAVTSSDARKLTKFDAHGTRYYLDPDVKAPSWLTVEEVGLAAARCSETMRSWCGELYAVHAMMTQYEAQTVRGGPLKTRLVVWST